MKALDIIKQFNNETIQPFETAFFYTPQYFHINLGSPK
jgi:hypothetical protein